ncbi:hypothetical protein CONPUDRAFT_106598 [Coniophora puteana RWD-64-598 SS2]|uniref:NAD(P)-binding protein n=1 Tax=Coniophora puteana (strain RWD-64-598) TaxID=741705 RepID=A0A5M3ML60_CONPW|nr:uncharacterized protein CONPUDRAFT_106598 [Coniophora puteana RWD-64-598 SS2]EIW79908.1 hypothetical protein CONPUDRAFT_106598 [Coniophora puteana RWD-64-598 SS2]
MGKPNPVVVVTGANGGVGFGICRRLLIQLCYAVPPDASIDRTLPRPQSHWLSACENVTLVLACRNVESAKRARQRLLKALDKEAFRQRKFKPRGSTRAERIRQNVDIRVHHLDLTVASSVLEFAEWLQQICPYVSHLICNAAMAPLDDHQGARRAARHQRDDTCPATVPEIMAQQSGEKSADGLGLVWQCNLFGHYMLYRALSPLFSVYSQKTGQSPRIIWMSTMTSRADDYDADDWQLLRTKKPYLHSKYQMELVANYFNLEPRKNPLEAFTFPQPRHFVVQPGVVLTKLYSLNGSGLRAATRSATVFLARLFGSHNHPRTTCKAAISAVHAALVELPMCTQSSTSAVVERSAVPGIKLHSRSPMFGKAYVDISEYPGGWSVAEACKARDLVGRCDELYDALVRGLHKTKLIGDVDEWDSAFRGNAKAGGGGGGGGGLESELESSGDESSRLESDEGSVGSREDTVLHLDEDEGGVRRVSGGESVSTHCSSLDPDSDSATETFNSTSQDLIETVGRASLDPAEIELPPSLATSVCFSSALNSREGTPRSSVDTQITIGTLHLSVLESSRDEARHSIPEAESDAGSLALDDGAHATAVLEDSEDEGEDGMQPSVITSSDRASYNDGPEQLESTQDVSNPEHTTSPAP